MSEQAAPMAAGDAVRLLAGQIIDLLAARGQRIAVAESLTGGLLADALVSIPGASRAFSGGIVAYDPALKYSLLGVDEDLLRERGPVDSEVARQMAAGVRAACATQRGNGAPEPAEVGVATTGVAGPDPDPQTGQPAGTVWIGISSDAGTFALRLELQEAGDRGIVRQASVAAALRATVTSIEAAGRT